MMSEEMVTISKVRYDELVKDQRFLIELETQGVDNWEGYGYARDAIEDTSK
jgi:hypothetical protein